MHGLALLSIWFNNPTQLRTALGLFLEGLNREKIRIASGTYEVVGMPPIHVEIEGGNGSYGS